MIANFFVLNMFVGVIVDSFQTSGNSVGDSDAAKEKRSAYERKQAQKVVQQQERFEQCVRLYRSDFGPCKKSIVKGVESDPFDISLLGRLF